MQVFLRLLEQGFSKEEAKQLADISDELVERVQKENGIGEKEWGSSS